MTVILPYCQKLSPRIYTNLRSQYFGAKNADFRRSAADWHPCIYKGHLCWFCETFIRKHGIQASVYFRKTLFTSLTRRCHNLLENKQSLPNFKTHSKSSVWQLDKVHTIFKTLPRGICQPYSNTHILTTYKHTRLTCEKQLLFVSPHTDV